MEHPTDIRIARRGWQSRRATIAASLLACAILGWCAVHLVHGLSERSLRVARDAVSIATVGRGTFRDVVPIHGMVQPKGIIYLDALAGGQVERILVQPGDRVVTGQPLILFRNAQLELDVLNNAGRLVESITQVQSFETQLETNRAANEKALADIRYNLVSLDHTVARIDPLLAKGFYPKRDAEAVQDQLDHYHHLLGVQAATNGHQEALRQAQLPALQAEQLSLRKSLAATHAQLDDLVVRAPTTGTVTQLDLKIGQSRERGQRLAEITTDAGYLVSASVDEYYLSRLKVGQAASVGIAGATYVLHVDRVHPEVTNGAFRVDLGFDGRSPATLTPGEAAEGRLSLGAGRPALVLPAGAFLQSYDGATVFVVDPDGGSAHRRTVRLGRHSDDQVEVLDGLSPGDRVVISDYATYGRIDRIDLVS